MLTAFCTGIEIVGAAVSLPVEADSGDGATSFVLERADSAEVLAKGDEAMADTVPASPRVNHCELIAGVSWNVCGMFEAAVCPLPLGIDSDAGATFSVLELAGSSEVLSDGSKPVTVSASSRAVDLGLLIGVFCEMAGSVAVMDDGFKSGTFWVVERLDNSVNTVRCDMSGTANLPITLEAASDDRAFF